VVKSGDMLYTTPEVPGDPVHLFDRVLHGRRRQAEMHVLGILVVTIILSLA
jgi:hypothetical protein